MKPGFSSRFQLGVLAMVLSLVAITAWGTYNLVHSSAQSFEANLRSVDQPSTPK